MEHFIDIGEEAMSKEKIDNIIEISELNKSFNQEKNNRLQVLNDISFSVKKGEFICIVGGSGCGKSTLLRTIAGLDIEYEGDLKVNGKSIVGPSKSRGLVFQEARLFPWMTVEQNVRFALDSGTKKEKDERVRKVLELVHLQDFAKAYPKELSGGMAQRANIARALVDNPPVLLLDEPFGALDAFTKIQLQDELLAIQQKEGTTMIMVTHDIEEAVYLADRVVVLSDRPGNIKDIISIDIPRERSRNESLFVYKKKKIFDYFFEDVERDEDYVI